MRLAALLILLTLAGCSGLACPPRWVDPDNCYTWRLP